MNDDVCEMVRELHSDCWQAETNLGIEDTPYNRRTYVRTIFSALEATIHFMRQIALTKRALFATDELDKLEEKERKYLPLKDSVAFVSKMYSRAIGSPFILDRSGKEWSAFIKAIEVRDNITHPKQLARLDISLDNIVVVRWAYQFVVRAMIQSLVGGKQASNGNLRRC